MKYDFYTNIGYAVVWFMKYIFIPLGVAISSAIITNKLLQPQPGRQRKKRSQKSRF